MSCNRELSSTPNAIMCDDFLPSFSQMVRTHEKALADEARRAKGIDRVQLSSPEIITNEVRLCVTVRTKMRTLTACLSPFPPFAL